MKAEALGSSKREAEERARGAAEELGRTRKALADIEMQVCAGGEEEEEEEEEEELYGWMFEMKRGGRQLRRRVLSIFTQSHDARRLPCSVFAPRS